MKLLACALSILRAGLLAFSFAQLSIVAWAQAASPTAHDPARREDAVTLLFAGDIVLDDDAGALIARGGDPLAEFAPIFAGADLRVANLECVVATTGDAADKPFTFRAHPRVLPVLKRHLDVVTLANNHSGDYGREAFAEMLGLLRSAGLAYVGGGYNLREAHTPLVVERKGLRIALLSYNEFLPRRFEADWNAPGVAWSEDARVVADIRRARELYRADLVIAFMHWGWESELTADARQRQLARTLLAAGADAVLGGHPHVRQEIEIIDGKPAVYSVGNFVMKETADDEQRLGWVLELTLTRSGVTALRTHTARIDRAGIPHVDPGAQERSWQR
ncbi:MAG: CapA family protein [Burkholderiales bacterium]|nr:MAG: CapA family protein [Burkholderiales bacterium]